LIIFSPLKNLSNPFRSQKRPKKRYKIIRKSSLRSIEINILEISPIP
jgi:hypothetical protein